jgi:hypothetical protein
MKMNKPASEKISGLMKNKYLIKYLIILFVLSISNNAMAGSPGTTAAGKVSASGIASAYQGTLSGEWSGESMGHYFSGSFTINIFADGTVKGSYSGFRSDSISGSVTASGNFNAEGSAGNCTWSGQIKSTEGRLSGSGTWTGFGGDGSWKGGQNQTER